MSFARYLPNEVDTHDLVNLEVNQTAIAYLHKADCLIALKRARKELFPRSYALVNRSDGTFGIRRYA